jgi:hypothetical protein
MSGGAMPLTCAQEEIHDRLVEDIVTQLINLPIEADSEFTDVLTILESVIVGVMLIGVEACGDKDVLELLFDHVKERLAQQRLYDSEPVGNA